MVVLIEKHMYAVLRIMTFHLQIKVQMHVPTIIEIFSIFFEKELKFSEITRFSPCRNVIFEINYVFSYQQ